MARKNSAEDESPESILDRQWDEIPETQTLPTGSWRLKARSASYQAAKGEGNPSVLFVLAPQEPLNDVDEDALNALGDNYEYDQNRLFHRVWLETAADIDGLRKLLAKFGVDVSQGSVKDSLKGVRGKEIIANLGQRTYTNNTTGETVEENTATNFAPVE